jgi:protein TonB
LTLKKFFVFSLVVHSIILFGVYHAPIPSVKEQETFITRLVSLDDLVSPAKKVPREKTIQRALPIPKTDKINEVPVVPKRAKREPSPEPPVVLKRVEQKPSPEPPVVPGEGTVSDGTLTDKPYPEEGAEKEQRSIPQSSSVGNHFGKEKIFDESIIGDIAKRDLDKFTKELRTDNVITFDTTEYRYAGYLEKLRERIEHIWIYPVNARARGIYGDLKIQFTIKKNGRLGAVELVRTSGYKMLDDAAIKALKDGEPYWPLPDEWGKESYTILGHFIYSLRGRYIR